MYSYSAPARPAMATVLFSVRYVPALVELNPPMPPKNKASTTMFSSSH